MAVLLVCVPRPISRFAAWGWLVAALASALLGVLQHVGMAHVLTPWVNDAPAGEVFANLRQRNQFATLINIGLASLMAAMASSPHRQAGESHGGAGPNGLPGWFRACLLLAAAVLLIVGDVLSRSRTGLAQLVLLCLPMVWWYRVRAAGALASGLLAIYAVVSMVLAWGGPPAILERITTDLGCSSRKVLWSNVLDLIAQKPWLGWGWGELDYAHYANLYGGERFCAILDNAHNLPLHLAVELGGPAALLVCGVTLWAAVRAQPWRETDPTRQLAWTVLAMVVLHSMVEYPLWYGPFQMAVGLCVVMLWTSRPGAAAVPVDKVRRFRALPQLVALVLLAGVGYAAWDYHRISQLYLPPDQRAAAYRADALGRARQSWLFRNQVAFAELTLTPLTRDNAAPVNAMATQLLHYSPEPRVIEKLIESAVLLQRDDEALWHLARYRAAFPKEHAAWVAGNARGAARAQ